MLTYAPLQVIFELVGDLTVLSRVSWTRLSDQAIDFVDFNVQVAIHLFESLKQASFVIIELFKHEREHILMYIAILVIERVLPRDRHLLDGILLPLLPQVRPKEVR